MYNKPVITYHPPMRTCWVLPDIDYWWAIAVLKPNIKNDTTARKKLTKKLRNSDYTITLSFNDDFTHFPLLSPVK